MKVSEKMIRKDLRLMGKICKRIKINPKKGKFIRLNIQLRTNNSRPSYNTYIKHSGNNRLRLLIRKTRNPGKRVPGVLWIHGGGYATGIPETAYLTMARFAVKECVVVSPDYTLSVEKPYPAALEDCYQALKWMTRHAEKLGIRDDQIFVGGESAGGGMTAALCLYARDQGEVNIACQIPLYPMLDDRMQSQSMKDNDAPVWDEDKNQRAWELYLDGCDKDNIPKYAAPARETDYSGLPPAITFVGGVEPFRDETIDYVRKLKKAGIKVDFKLYNGCFHTFDLLVPWSTPAKRAKAFFIKSLRHACANYYAPQP